MAYLPASPGLPSLNNIAALRASNAFNAATTVLILGYYTKDDGGEGLFSWDPASVIADNGGTIIKPTAIVGVGRWVRQVLGNVYDPRMFGAKGDLATDDYPAFQALLDWLDVGGFHPTPDFVYGVSVHIPTGQWRLSQRLRIKRQLRIYGDGPVNTVLFLQNAFPGPGTPIDGIVFDKDDGPVGTTLFFGGSFSSLKDLKIIGDGNEHDIVTPEMPCINESDPVADSSTGIHPGCGVVSFKNVILDNVWVEGFKYDGFHINTRTGINDNSHNANVFRCYSCIATQNGRHGLYVMGENSNAGLIINFNATSNAGWGLYERSFLGNTYIGGHCAENGHFITNIYALLLGSSDINQFKQNQIFAGAADGGIYESIDRAVNWRERNQGLQVDDDPNPDHSALTAPIICLCQGPGQLVLGGSGPSIYAGVFTSGTGVFRLTRGTNGSDRANGGLTDKRIQTIFYNGSVFPFTGTRAFVGTPSGVFISDNIGNADPTTVIWSASNTGLTTTDVRAIVVDPADPTHTMYAGTFGGKVFKSADNGATWTQVPTGFASANVLCLTMVTGALYAGCDDGTIYKTVNGGTNWTLVFTEPGAHSINALTINPNNNTKIFAATRGAGMYVSLDSGGTWIQHNTGLQDIFAHPLLDIRSVQAANDDKVYVGVVGHTSNPGFNGGFSPGSVFRSDDNGTTWTEPGLVRNGGGYRAFGGTNASIIVGAYVEADQTNCIEDNVQLFGGILASNFGTNPAGRVSFSSGIENIPHRGRSVYKFTTFKPEAGANNLSPTFDQDEFGLVLVDCSDLGGVVTIPVPTATDYGKMFTVMRVDNTLGNALSVHATATTIEGFGSDVFFNTQYECATFVATASGYRMLNRRAAKLSHMTQAQRDAISTPETSLIVFNTDTSKLNFWDGAAWRVVTST